MKKTLVLVSPLVVVLLACGNSGRVGAENTYSCPNPPVNLPTPTEPCPILQTTFNSDYTQSTPIMIKGKQADIIVGTRPTPETKVPFYFYWHGVLQTPTKDIAASVKNPASHVLEEGGVVVGLYGDFTGAGGSIILQFDNGHLAAADELLACAIQQHNIDICRIHTSGMSMGGLMVTQMSYLRSNYLASAVSCSGGLPSVAPADQNPANKLPVMIAYGGSSDVFPPFNFYNTSTNFFNDLKANGHFAIMCDHNAGHTVPESIVTAAWQFLRDHPYGVTPEPYAFGLPVTYPPYCSLENIPPAPTDAGVAMVDAAAAPTDAGAAMVDAAAAPTDAGAAISNTGAAIVDAAAAPTDAGAATATPSS
jgi:hypothetical protein